MLTPWGFIDRSGNPFGFWSALLLYILYGVAVLAILWLVAEKACSVAP
jgi:hypothetical protein